MGWITTPLIMLLLLLLKGFFSGSEIALVSADKIRIRHQARQGRRGARRLLGMLRNPDRLLTTTLVGTNLATVAFTTIGTVAMVQAFGGRGDLYAFLVFTPLLLVLGEIVPKSVYQQKAEAVAPVIVYPLSAAAGLFFPLVFLFSRVARLAVRLMGGDRAAQSVFLTREQFRAVLEMTERRSSLAVFKQGRIRRAIRFGATQAAEVMTPLRDVACLSVDDSAEKAFRLARELDYRPIPVYRGNVADIVGMAALTPWDVLGRRPEAASAADLAAPAGFAAPQQTLAHLLPMLRGREDQSAVVVDEYGSAVGLVTLADVLEVVVGEVRAHGRGHGAHHGRRKRSFQVVEEGVFLLDAKLSISAVNDVLGLNLPTEAFRTLAGMLLAHLKHIPKPGEWVVESGYRFSVEEATEKEVLTVRAAPEPLAGR